jgi:hypothetical protein
VSQAVRCAACGARNSATAGWCTQCYAPLGASSPPAAEEVAAPDLAPPSGAAASSVAEPPSPAVPGGAPGPTSVSPRDVRDVDGTVEWRCARCDGWSPLLAATCATCGRARLGFGEREPDRASPDVDPRLLTAASVVLPGAGHLLAHRPGTGSARLLLWLLWLVGGLATVRGAGSLRLAAPGLVLLAGAAVLWAATLVDVRRFATGDDREVLAARPLLWLVGGVLVALVLAVLAAAFLAR